MAARKTAAQKRAEAEAVAAKTEAAVTGDAPAEADAEQSADERVAALEAELAGVRSQLAEAEVALGAAPAPVAAASPAAGTPVWVRDASGRAWYVEVGSVPYENVLAQGGQVFDPEADDSAE